MTNHKIAEMYEMRLNGCTLNEIAERFGISKQRVQQLIPDSGNIRFAKAINQCIYPNIRKWMYENNSNWSRFAVLSGLSINRIRRALIGENITKSVIDKILDTTGLSYEIAFAHDTETGEDVD